MPNIWALQDEGAEFTSHYANTPVCCPSRATFWSGRHAHNIPHDQKTSGIFVEGAWNNYEGLPPNFTLRMDQVLSRNGYDVRMSGKQDYTTGAHSNTVRISAWTKYARLPYNVSLSPGGWTNENGCVDQGTVLNGNETAHGSDWKTVTQTTDWIRTVGATTSKPFFVYQGMSIVHPPYKTNQYWLAKVDQRKIKVPDWDPIESLHPCDFQSSMLKGCIPPKASKEGAYFYKKSHRRKIRSIYLAMIAEFDAMVGEYVKAVREIGKYGSTVFIVTSDHGDMQMEHQQFYKMVPYDASARVPMVIVDGRHPLNERYIVNKPTQLIDIYPTVLTFARVSNDLWPQLDGRPLQPLLPTAKDLLLDRPDFVVSQFHGDNIAMSWFFVVHSSLKLIVWGTGEQHPHQLFNLTADPDENVNLASRRELQDQVGVMLQKLKSVVDYPMIARNVAKYGHESMKYWMSATPNWKDFLASGRLRWHDSWSVDPLGALKAVEDFIASPPEIAICRSELAWPQRWSGERSSSEFVV